jgi:hypothetical protein
MHIEWSDKLKNMEMKDVFAIEWEGIEADCLSSYLDNQRKESPLFGSELQSNLFNSGVETNVGGAMIFINT